MADAKRTFNVVVERMPPQPTGQECPRCGFDSILATLFLFNNRPFFAYSCGRQAVCDFMWVKP